MPKRIIENYVLPAVDPREVLRYAGMKGEGGDFVPLLKECEKECSALLTPKAVYVLLTKDELFALLPSAKKSESLQAALSGGERAFLFAATVGLELDRRIARYAQLSPSKALFFQALGAERIESLCDEICKRLTEERGVSLGRRFSPGYGDFSLEAQKEVFRILDCPKNIGLTLTDGLMMSPTKSVTAIACVIEKEKDGEKSRKAACESCKKTDCEYGV